MGLAQTISKSLKQKAVYWGNPQNDGYGGFTYDDPIEIDCRWEDATQVFDANDDKGTKFISRAVVYVNRDIDYLGRIYLGTLLSLQDYLESSSGTYIDPNSIEDVGVAHIVRRFEKIPELGSSSKFIRIAYLSPWLNE